MQKLLPVLLLLSTLHLQLSTAFAQGTAFTYQGQLQNNGGPASGNYAMTFALFNTNASGVAIAGPVTNNAVSVGDGLFTVVINFGANVFTGQTNWLQIGVATNGVSSFTLLSPRQQLTPTPYAVYAENTSNLLGALPVAQISGAVANGQLANDSVTVSAGTGLSGGGTVALGGSTTLNNAGVLSVTGNADITASTASGAVTLGDTGTNAAIPRTLVKRDATGSFAATNLTLFGTLTLGNATDYHAVINEYGGNSFIYADANNNFSAGESAGYGSGMGSFNTAIGNSALDNTVGGSFNTAVGWGTIAYNFYGSNNTAIGYSALGQLGSVGQIGGANNLALGYQAGNNFMSVESNNIDIGNAGNGGENDTIRLGTPGVQTNTFIAGVINGNGTGLTNLNASQLNGSVPSAVLTSVPAASLTGTVPLARLTGITSNQLNASTWQLATNLNGGNAALASNVVSGISITNAFITSSVFAGNGGGLTNLNASQLASGVVSSSVLPGFQSSSNYCTVGGGQANVISGQYATIGGGDQNTNSDGNGTAATIGGGQNNIITNGYQPTIGGGYGNNASSSYATIGGGNGNNASGVYAAIGGGESNTNSSQAGAIAGGQNNTASGQYQATVGGGYGNKATNNYATVPGGSQNIAGGQYSFAAGQQAQAVHQGAFVWADSSNAVFASTASNQFNVRATGGVRFVTSGAGMTLDGQPVLTNNQFSPTFSGTVTATSFQGDSVGDFVAGQDNSATGGTATVGGGNGNTASGEDSTVGGGSGNNATVGGATIGGGYNNNNSGGAGTIGGGQNNTASGVLQPTVGGGYGNNASGSLATVPGGSQNIAAGQCSFAAGQQAQALHQGAFVWADSQNATFSSTTTNQFNVRATGGVRFVTSGVGMTLDGGTVIQGDSAGDFVAGQDNSATGGTATVGGGNGNTASGEDSTVGGGSGNNATVGGATIGGGYNNNNSGGAGTIGGGQNNTASGVLQPTVGGGYGNNASGSLATVPGGSQNIAAGQCSFAAGQQAQALHQGAFVWADSQNAAFSSTTTNQFNVRANGGVRFVTGGAGITLDGQNVLTGFLSSSNYCTVGGGQANVISGQYATIGGGDQNTNTDGNGTAATIGGGQNNIITNGYQPTIGGGYGNSASGNYATVAGGNGNIASGQWSSIGGGLNNQATDNNTVVPGGANNIASGLSCFAAGLSAQAVNNHSFVWGDGSATTTSTADDQFMLRASGGVIIYSSSGTSSGVSLPAGSGTWASLSDRNAKNDFTPVTPQQVLAKVAALPITTWSYKTEAGVQHMGPMAQDFYAAFRVGEDDRHITTVDEGGVALAAIQGLNQKVEERDARIQEQAGKIDELQRSVAELKAMIQSLAAQK